MKKSLKTFLIFLLILFCAGRGYSHTTHPEPKTLEIGSRAPDFNLTGVDWKTYSLKDFDKVSCGRRFNICPTVFKSRKEQYGW